jgi:hypothetical protein
VETVAWVPGTPLLVPEIAAGSIAGTAALRQAALDAAITVVRSAPDAVLVVAPTDTDVVIADRGEAVWSWHGFGVGTRPAVEWLPWPLGLGAWLLDQAGWRGPTRLMGIGPDEAPRRHEGAGRWGMLVLGDGSAKRTERAPGHLDERAQAWDLELQRLVVAADLVAMRRLDRQLGHELMSTAATTWPVAATFVTDAARMKTDVLFAAAPFGVGYIVATWSS